MRSGRKNIRAVACSRGHLAGQDDDVHVFDVQHIKGLEFEAVFFVGVDRSRNFLTNTLMWAQREPQYIWV